MYVQLHSLVQEILFYLCSQGTGAVTLACILAAIRISLHSSSRSTKPKARLSDQRFVIFGAGSAGMGITVQLRDAMMTTDGISREDANTRFWIIDKEGLLYEDSGVDKEENKGSDRTKELRREFYRPQKEIWTKDSSGIVSLLDVVRGARPTVLIGASTRAGAFTEEVVKAMVRPTRDLSFFLSPIPVG